MGESDAPGFEGVYGVGVVVVENEVVQEVVQEVVEEVEEVVEQTDVVDVMGSTVVTVQEQLQVLNNITYLTYLL